MTEPPVEGFSGPPGASGSFAASGSRSAVPRMLAERARDLSDGRLTPAVPRDAATVILLRQGADAGPGAGAGVEAFLLRRTAELEFAPGACVFPGGSVDERDADPGIGWAGPAPEDFAAQLDVPPERARSLVCAAIRETFEESGILLAEDGSGLVGDSAALAADRHALLTGTTTLGEVLGRRGLMLRTDLLTPWARWITPEVSPRRFDTWFFAAALPAGQTATAAPEGHTDPGESESGTWLRPGAALDAAQAGEITLLPPTAVTLRELAAHQDVDGILACRRTITPRLPRVIVEDGKVRLSMPPLAEEPS
ncbi:MAG TPA: NUDIX hydrolase [Streptosporangiaceae bacterium]|nr:NUDIX hydrolase [Streptosporangiaceae bacterium]